MAVRYFFAAVVSPGAAGTAFEITAPAGKQIKIRSLTLSSQAALGMVVSRSNAATAGGTALVAASSDSQAPAAAVTANKFTSGANGGTIVNYWTGIVPGASSFPVPLPTNDEEVPTLRPTEVFTISVEAIGVVYMSAQVTEHTIN